MDELAKRFADLADKYGPSVADAAMSAARIDGYSSLVGGIVYLLLFAALAYLTIRVGSCGNDGEIFAIIIGMIAFCFLVCAGINLLDPWTYVAISHPEIWLAKQALHP